MTAILGGSCRAWLVGLLLILGVQLIFGTLQDGEATVLSFEADSRHDRPYADADRLADFMEEAQEPDDNVSGPDHGLRPPFDPAGLRVAYTIKPVPGRLMPAPFRPPRLFQ